MERPPKILTRGMCTMKTLWALSIIICLTNCTVQKSASPKKAALDEAVGAPLIDLNLVRAAIPSALHNAKKNPYAQPLDQTCEGIATEIHKLDEVLGADLDSQPTEKNPSLVERGVDDLGKASLSAIKRTTESVIPFRNWVRKLTGAERHSNAVEAAIAAGGIRRAYLKGFGQSKGCHAPAAPEEFLSKR